MRNLKFVILFILVATFGCAPSVVTQNYMEKSFKPEEKRKMIVFFVGDRKEGAIKFEDKFASYFTKKGYDMTAGHILIDSLKEPNIDKDLIVKEMLADGYDGVYTLRIVEYKEETKKVDNTYYKPSTGLVNIMDQYYFDVYQKNKALEKDEPLYNKKMILRTEARYYDLNSGKEYPLVWSIRMRTENPEYMKRIVRDLSKTIYKQSMEDGVL
ncbi:hypothetical protein [Aureibacter tunicatorum]|uniref:Lipoprotein n=1 Tax=Aureibacter tunicatorum TaxID=866807 RepID=A0AAE4BT04_9BACT|nr:hypothetical protein [Aureibacter tunicatorum]MDR6239455.1 hypothetical protein [Aureibacter tunicatorum]BDD04622.1 hypothetical protein AUTU_21050 [Aureibacter tunicatorum]